MAILKVILEVIGLIGSIASIASLVIAIIYLPTLIHWRKVKKVYKHYVDPNLLQTNDRFFANFNSYYIRANKEEREIIQDATNYAPKFHKDTLRCIMNMVDSMEQLDEENNI